MKMTAAQLRFLRSIESRGGFLRCRDADMRVHSGLLKRGLIALTYNDGGRDSTENGYVTTPAGRAALTEESGDPAP